MLYRNRKFILKHSSNNFVRVCYVERETFCTVKYKLIILYTYYFEIYLYSAPAHVTYGSKKTVQRCIYHLLYNLDINRYFECDPKNIKCINDRGNMFHSNFILKYNNLFNIFQHKFN